MGTTRPGQAGWAGAWRDRRGSPPPNALGGSREVVKGERGGLGEEAADDGRGTGCGRRAGRVLGRTDRRERGRRVAGQGGAWWPTTRAAAARGDDRPGASGWERDAAAGCDRIPAPDATSSTSKDTLRGANSATFPQIALSRIDSRRRWRTARWSSPVPGDVRRPARRSSVGLFNKESSPPRTAR